MTEISYPIREPSPLSPRTAKYVAALMREGDNFEYDKWLQGVREEEAEATQALTAITCPNPVGSLGLKSPPCRHQRRD